MTNAVTPTTRPTVSATSVMSRNAAESPPAMAAWRDSRSADSSVRPRQRLRTASLDATVSRQPWRPQRHSCAADERSEEHTSELQSRGHLVCRLLLEKKNNIRLP